MAAITLSTSYYARRHRSSSCGSVVVSNDVMSVKRKPNPQSASELMQILLNLRDSDGNTILHQMSARNNDHLLALSHALLKRASELDTKTYKLWMNIPDRESGYTPLHLAILEANLTTILLLLRGAEPRLTQRPLDGLSQANIMDTERLTPLALLGRCATPYLKACRASLPIPSLIVNPSDDDTSTVTSTSTTAPQHACEVITFGRSHHCALGVSHASSTTIKSRPCRVKEFAISERGVMASAIMVAAAAHHSLVVTRQGELYAFGFNKNGRLGTGNDQHAPLPVKIQASLNKKHVTFVAAAENHSLAVTKDGMVYGWGSNRFGQLGKVTDTNRVLPKRIDELKNCIAVAAGDKHSVALTRNGQVYTWGDNAAGQLGRIHKSGGVQRVDALWKSTPRKVTIAIAASEQSTLVLCCPTGMGLHVNTVYAWGHGNHVPMKVNFDSKQKGSSYHRYVINPIAITCAKYHSAIITSDGFVYCWGLHAESLGMPKNKSYASPQLVTGMLPQNGGGIAVAVSASEHHTAVVTEDGHLFTWGAHTQQNGLGHEGVRFQQTPKQVPGVYRAVGVASAKEHTILLVGTAFPTIPFIPREKSLSLENIAARKVAEHVDLFNVIPILIMAERTRCVLLIKYCKEFVKRNLDGVLMLGRKSEMDMFLNEQLADAILCSDRDLSVHPLIYDVVTAGDSPSISWMQACDELLANLPISTLVCYRDQNAGDCRRRALSLHERHELHQHGDMKLQTSVQGCSDRCSMLTANMKNLSCSDDIRSKYDCLSKEVRGMRKRLAQIAKLRLKEILTSDEREKLTRNPLLEADLSVLEPALEIVNRLMAERNMVPNIVDPVIDTAPVDSFSDTKVKRLNNLADNEHDARPPQFNCDLCKVSCPDANHLDLHTNGRKHRNRALQVQEEEKNQAAASMMEEKRKKIFTADSTTPPQIVVTKSSPWGKSSLEPRYTLSPPPLGGESAVKTPLTYTTITSSSKQQPIVGSADFRSILAEEEKKKSTSLKSTIVSKQKTKALLSPESIPVLKDVPWSIAPNVRVTTLPMTSVSQAKSYPLIEFALPPRITTPKTTGTSVAVPWATCQDIRTSTVLASSLGHGKSLLQIQQEETEYQSRNKSRNETKDGKWFIQRTERAGSFSAIQEAEVRDREMDLLIEEQKRIESEIALENLKKCKPIQPTRRKYKTGGSPNAKGKKQKPGERKKAQQGQELES